MAGIRRIGLCLSLIVFAVGATLAQDCSDLKDEAKLFKPDTLRKAGEAARDLRKYGMRLAIETYPTVPKESIDKVKAMNGAARNEFFQTWARKRVKDLGEYTILILLTAEPKHLETAIGSEAEKKFTSRDRQAMTSAMLAELRKMQPDAALVDAVTLLRKHFDLPAKDNP